MLGTLFKYDFKALGRSLGFLQLGVLVGGLFGSFLIGMSYRAASTSWNSSKYSSTVGTFESVISGASSAIGSLIFAAVFASSLVTLFLIARYYYKNFFGDEGYLTFTLPVKPGQLMWSKLLAGVIWILINTLVILLVCVSLSLFGFTEGVVNPDTLEAYGELFAAIATPLGGIFTGELVLLLIFSEIMNVLMVYAALSIGCSVAKTQKIMASVGFYVLFTFVLSTVLSFIMMGSLFAMIDTYSSSHWSSSSFESEWFNIAQGFVMPMFVCMIASTFALYFMAKGPIRKNLNLN